jgi:hypothetical protein
MKQAYKDIVNKEFLQGINSESEMQKMHDVHIKRIDDENDKSFILHVDDNPAGIFKLAHLEGINIKIMVNLEPYIY